ncbi:MAG: hypothetical protein E7436_08050 [Ruminococcaceae bacterium]|nr:hypothetical protein [Oscillospiraceae bacterium]
MGRKKKFGIPAGVGIGIGVGVLVMLAGAMILAWLMAGERVPESAMSLGATVILVLSSSVGCLAAWAAVGRNRLPLTGMTMGGIFLVLILGGLVFGGVEGGIGTTLAMIGIGGGISWIPAVISGKGGVKRRKIRPYR